MNGLTPSPSLTLSPSRNSEGREEDLDLRDKKKVNKTRRKLSEDLSSSWSTEELEEEEEEEEEEEKSLSSSSSTSLEEDNNTPTPPPSPEVPLPLILRSTRSSSSSSSREDRLRYYQSLPLRTQIRLLIERALEQQLRENRRRGSNSKRPWIRRFIDTVSLQLLVFIMKFHRELFILFVICVTGLMSLKSSPVKTRPTPDPRPFFENSKSLHYVEDFYRGEYIDLVQSRINLGPAFVFYYAPWDSESVAARNVFVNVAKYFHHKLPNRIRFYAVNCWWPSGECRKNYKNLSHFPILVAHVERNSGIIYGGPIRTELIIKFLNTVLKPLTRIDSEDELWRFRAQHDAIMLAHFNFTEAESVSAYETYRQMALRSFEADPFGQIGFGIFLKAELAEKYFLTSSNAISLVLFNEIHTAKWTGDKDTPGMRGPVGQVASWITERTKNTPITWAYQIRTGFASRPVALGAIDLVDELLKGPVMLLITRRYFPSAYSPFYSQLKEVALDYFNCNKSGNVTRLRRTTHQINSEWITLWNSVSRICESQLSPSSETCILLEDQLNHWSRKKNSLRRDSNARFEALSERLNFTGFSCSSDREFKFLAVDPVDVPNFVDKGFGGLGFHNDSDPMLFIIDVQNDMLLPLTRFNITELTEVIYNYTNEVESNEDALTFVSSLWSDSSIYKGKSTLGGAVTSSSHHSSSSSGYQEFLGDKDIIKKGPGGITRKSLVRPINSEDLLKTLNGQGPPSLQEPNNDTPMFLMYTAKFCGACGVAATNFIELARFMEEHYHSVVNISFAKIDMVKNSLPSVLSPDKIPTFAFFPGNDKTDVRVFPVDEPITTKTLLQFLLAELDPETRIKLSLRSPGCSSSQQDECIIPSEEDPRRVKHHQIECIRRDHGSNNSTTNSTSSTSARDHCISVNRATVADKLQHIFNEIQHGYYSHHDEEEVGRQLGVNLDSLKTEDLDHLRSMKITLDTTA